MHKNYYQPQEINEILHQISFYPNKRLEIFLKLSYEIQACILLRLSKHILRDLLSKMSDQDLIMPLEQLDPDDASYIIQYLPDNRQSAVIANLTAELKHGVDILKEFDPQTAGRLINLHYIQVEINEKVSEVAKKFKSHEKKTGKQPAIIVLSNGKIAGHIPGHQLGFALPSECIKQYIRHIPIIKHNASHDQVIKIFKEHPHNKIAVIGPNGNVIGIIYSDNVLRIIEEQASASLYDFAGVHEEESVTDSAKTKIKLRYKWLIVNLGTAFLAAFTVSLFDETISKYVLLAVYMPIVAGMGGNAATQTLAIVVRGIALKQIELKTALPTLKRELLAAFANGLINGLIVAIVVITFNRDIRMAIVLGIAMIINLLVAGFFGTIVPLIMEKLGKDPATSATIFITTATDVLGFMTFLGLASIILK